MSSPEEIGAHSNKDSVDGLAEAPKAVSLKDVEDHEPVLATRDGECCDYRMGICKQSEKCGSKHPHVPYPSSSKWDTHHMQRLRFECYAFNVDPKNWSDDKVICEWVLRVFRHRIPDTFSEYDDEKIDTDPDLPELPIALHTTHSESVASIIDRMSGQLSKELQEDSFLIMLKNFVSKYDLKNASIQKLCQAVLRGDFMPQGVTHYAHRNTLFAWVDALNMYSRGAFTESCLDELLASIINSAGNETDTLIRIKIRESTAKTINVCGQAVNVQGDIAVWSAHGDCVLQVITCIEDVGDNESKTEVELGKSSLLKGSCKCVIVSWELVGLCKACKQF
ncbi:uncharacterized protein [Ptychodera flava]|uniref:uncharacterized protein isoform X2 n=1 Tax=Ptychodera flava TaxID=63121 RepID=UPI00396A9864